MLVGQTALYFLSNAFSAVFGFVNVIIFTRLFAPSDFSDYVLGTGSAILFSTFQTSWLRLHVMREQARDDGTDARALILAGLIVSCLAAPLGYLAAVEVGLKPAAAFGSVCLGLAISGFDVSQDLLKARLRALTCMQGTMIRALLISALGVGFALAHGGGAALLISAGLGYLLATLAFWRSAWGATRPRIEGRNLWRLIRDGLPVTVSLTLLALSGVIDRFLVAHLAGEAAAAQYGVGVDLVRQALIIPAISVAAAFMPSAVQILAKRGRQAAEAHLEHYLELLLAIALPSCVGFAIVSPHLADLILGPAFRDLARTIMPIVSVAVVFQIVTHQYAHVGFLLSKRNAFYLINIGSVIVFNAIACYALISRYGPQGAAWARLAAEAFGCAGAFVLTVWAFRLPLPIGRLLKTSVPATLGMGLVVAGLDRLTGPLGPAAVFVLIPAGMASYALLCLAANVADIRDQARERLMRWRRGAAHAPWVDPAPYYAVERQAP